MHTGTSDSDVWYILIFLALIVFVSQALAAEENINQSLEINADQSNRKLIFTAPPRGEKDEASYLPIVDFLSRQLKLTIVYKKPSSWEKYNKDMWNGVGDIYFDGPHFSSWRISNLGHTPVAKLPQNQTWKLIVAANSNIRKFDQLVGKWVCLQGVSNNAKLSFFQHYKNPLRQPMHRYVKSREQSYLGVINGSCAAGVVSSIELNIYNNKYKKEHRLEQPPIRVLHTHDPHPNQAFTVSPNISEALRIKLQRALLSDKGQKASYNLRRRYANGAKLVSANSEEYKNLGDVLRDTYGFGFNFKHDGGALNENNESINE